MGKLIPLEVADLAVERLQLEIKKLQQELKHKEEIHNAILQQLNDVIPKIMAIGDKINQHSEAINLLADGMKKRDRELMYLSDLILAMDDDELDLDDNTDE